MHTQVFLLKDAVCCDYSLICTYKSIVMLLRIIPAAKITRPENEQHQSYGNPANCHHEDAIGTSLGALQTTWD
jgi:hypothetical protein